MGFLSRQFHLWVTPCLSKLHKSPVLPILDYCSIVSGTLAQHYILTNLNPYRTLLQNVSSWNNYTPPMMIAWDSCICPDCPSAAWDTNFPFVTELWQADPLYLLVLFFTLYLCPHLHHNYTTWHLSCYCIAKCLVTTVAWLILLWNFMNAMLHGKDSCSGTDTWEKPY